MVGLQVENVCKTYGSKRVVDGVSFDANKGEILGFLGPNGAGKTTTIRMIMGITLPDSGEIRFRDGERVYSQVPQSQIGYLPEERGLYKEAKVMRILLFLAGLKNIDASVAKQRAQQWLTKFDLANHANSKVEELSKGMAQKVQFIGSVLHEPQYIILDEPFSGLDPVSQDIFKRELRDLANRGATILLSSHQMNILEELCDRIFLIHQGKEVFHGSLVNLKERFGSFVIRIHTADESSISSISHLPMIASYKALGSLKHELLLKDGVSAAEFLASIPANTRITELSVASSSLHDIFVKIALGGKNEE